eukprot:CAMPEP_0202457762 /NCGR_PEP_ID=MMETSP1360-20130828/14689_1 /ASSEMBLY_ACC=CAM_ASM_000848 /TAXON_ID=515479 /ORGANISM="Licmophora paradoxa, Strain CCMP2313" /LENGTH=491 /DNA_ID=CAMNT_0049077921 /DNA_START=76 /DNA_END=1551 /DNA_ORIENTATION=-
MGLKLRRIKSNTLSVGFYDDDDDDDGDDDKDNNDGRSNKGSSDFGLILFLSCGLIALVFAITQDLKAAGGLTFATDGIRLPIEEDAIVTLNMKRLNDNEVSLGPHQAAVIITNSLCQTPRIWMRLKGDALVLIPLNPAQDDIYKWTATFYLPLQGNYELDARFYGCQDSDTTTDIGYQTIQNQVTFTAGNGGISQMLPSKSSKNIFPVGLWLNKDRFREDATITNTDYVWFAKDKISSARQVGKFYVAKSNQGESTVTVEGNPMSSDDFNALTNYELVCWVGGESSAAIRDAFFSVRAEISVGQRPFKFHYYPMTDFVKPDKDWDDTKRGGFRKCKHVLVSLDEPEVPMSQAEYTKQVLNFLGHLVKCLQDETFPIWMFTVNTPPMKPTKLCHHRSKLTYHHPCNDALFEIFQKKYLPAQVNLLDNTDLVGPIFELEGQKDVTAVIAMRIYALVGAQVKAWRGVGQMGRKDGLMRNGTLEPNHDHGPYQFN